MDKERRIEMKKILIFCGIFITFFILYFLQTNFFSWFTIAGIKPNLFVILILFVGLFAGKMQGVLTGAIGGVLLDLFIGKNVGPTGIMLGLVGFLGGYFDKNFSKDSKITIIFMVLGATFVYELGKYMFNILLFKLDVELLQFIKILMIELVYQALLTIILYPLMKKVGYYIENVFKGNNILTRYF